jgi:beta-galactosidase
MKPYEDEHLRRQLTHRDCCDVRSERAPGVTGTDVLPVGSWASTSGLDGLVYGADYNPEQWPEGVWLEDVRLMREANVNRVSLGVFSWSKLEPDPGRFDFAWLDRVFDLLHANGIGVNLATPTAAPPPWLARLHPEILPVTSEGVRLRVGSRRHYCPHASAYRQAAAHVVRALAEHYRDHPALALWHVDNEYACHVGECFCDQSTAAFRMWLERRYATLDALNKAWATVVWGQAYTSWQEIEPPRPLPAPANPSQELDWRRFWSDSWIECFLEQRGILREITPAVPATTNFMSFHVPIDYWALAADEDVVAGDVYPETSDPEWVIDSAMAGDLMRSLGGGRPWLLMEQAVAHATWRERNSTKRPGVMRLGSYQSVARGADGVMFFQWRSAPAGAEMHMIGLVSHGGTDSRQWREAVRLGAELKGMSELRGSRVRAEVAILFDWNNLWALEAEGKPSSAIHLTTHARALYAALFRLGVTADFAEPGSDLSRYRLVVAPHLYLVDDAAAANLQRYVANGGTLLMSFFSGLTDPNVHIRQGGHPAAFRELLGVLVEEFAPFTARMANGMRTQDGRVFECSMWADVVRLEGAEAMATFTGDFYKDRPAVTCHSHGGGSAIYLATMPDEEGLAWVAGRACEEAGVSAAPGACSTVEIVRRGDSACSWLFVLNHSAAAVEVPLARSGVELTSGRTVKRSLRVGPVDAAIVREL